MPLAIQQILNNRYRIDEILSQNDVGATYRAWDMSLNLAVAIKENNDTTAESRRRFKDEAHILTRLSHPHLPRVTDYFFIPRQAHYLVTHWVDGETLHQRLRKFGPLPESDLLIWFPQICNALAYLHYQQIPIIHGNITSRNIKIRADGRVMLVGFGIGKIYQLELRHGTGYLNNGYSPIELYHGTLPDAVSDIYALAATLYYLLTAELPPTALDRSPNDAPLNFVQAANQPINTPLKQTLRKALEPARERRYQNANQFRAALEDSVAGASIYRDVMYVLPSNIWTFIAGLAILGIFACAILSITSFIRDNTWEIRGVTLLERPTPQPLATATLAPFAIGTTTSPIMQNFKSVALGFSLDYPRQWRKRAESLQVSFSPSLKGLDSTALADISIWAGASPSELDSPAQILQNMLKNFPQNARLIAQESIPIAGQDWRSAQIEFPADETHEGSMAVIATTRREQVGYFLVVAAPLNQWETALPIFQQTIGSFQFTKEVEVRLLNPDELPPTPTATATPVIYTVQSGDSLGRISAMYGVKIETLMNENDIKPSDYLRVGQELIIPIGFDD